VSLAKGMVTIDVPEELAWEVVLEWTDYVALSESLSRAPLAIVSMGCP
jgi:hypothetical protein